MAFQLIYTSAARLLDSPLSGYGVVARSEAMPTALVRRLIELSEFKEPADEGIAGPQCSYRVEEVADRRWHILTCVCQAGADYSQRSCHLAHHVIFGDEEVRTIAALPAAATPAGIILGLALKRFWVTRWQDREPEYIPDIPLLELANCPSAENQPTWLIFSGSAMNARIFCTPPYDRGCLALTPSGTQSRDILRLLHESAATTAELGWGLAFCTYSVETDELSRQCRLFSTPESALHRRARAAEFPTIDIRPGLTLPSPMPAAPGEPPQTITPPTPAPVNSETPLAALPIRQNYKYFEAQDEDIFDKAWRKPRRKPSKAPSYIGIGAAALLIISLLGVGLSRSCRESEDEPTLTLWSEADAPENTQPIATTQNKRPTHATPPAEEIERTAPLPPQGEPESPAHQETPEPLPPAPAESMDDTNDPEPLPAEETIPDALPVEVKATLPLIEGSQLPDFMMELPTGSERILELGNYIVHIGSREGQFSKIYKQELKRGESRIILRRTSANEFCIYSMLAQDDPTAPPTIRLTVVGNELQQIRGVYDTDTAAVQLPLANEAGELINVLLLPRISLHLMVIGCAEPVAPPPHTAENAIRIRPDLIINDKGVRQLNPEAIAKSPWAGLLKQSCKLKFSEKPRFALPQLTQSSQVEMQRSGGRAAITCELMPDDKTPHGYTCSIKQNFDITAALQKRFYRFVNEPCCGELIADKKNAANYTVARLLKTLETLISLKGKNDKQVVDQYVLLYKHAVFGEHLRKFFFTSPTTSELTVSAETAAAITPNNIRLSTRELREALKESHNRSSLILAVYEGLSLAMEAEYNSQRKLFADSHPKELFLRLADVRLNSKKKLVWVFELVTP